MSSLRVWQSAVDVLGIFAVIPMEFIFAQLPAIVSGPAQGTLGYDGRATNFRGRAGHRVVSFESGSLLQQAGVHGVQAVDRQDIESHAYDAEFCTRRILPMSSAGRA